MRERIGCDALILACTGYGGNPDLVRHFIPEMAEALYFGHPGNRGDAVLWGEEMARMFANLGAYEGHGSVATPHNILVTWAVIMRGGIQVNADGRRFCDDSRGYSEQAADVLRQPGGFAWEYSMITSPAWRANSRIFGMPSAPARSLWPIRWKTSQGRCASSSGSFRRWHEVEDLKSSPGTIASDGILHPIKDAQAPLCAVKVTGALFHTQGGLAIDASTRVQKNIGGVFSNLFAAGGAAAGVSGSTAAGYLSGNGLLTATVLGRVSGDMAARHAMAANKNVF